MEMLAGQGVVADIGCDHGRLSCALVQRGLAERCIAIDISAPSLDKTRRLAAWVGVSDRVQTRLGDGFTALAPYEADAVCLMGMGGTLMARLFSACAIPFNGAGLAVLQPMRAAEDIRAWLYENRCWVLDDRVAEENGRLYQVFAASAPRSAPQPLPDGWPEDCWFLGYTAFSNRAPLFAELLEQQLALRERRLMRGEAPCLRRQAEQLHKIKAAWEGRGLCN